MCGVDDQNNHKLTLKRCYLKRKKGFKHRWMDFYISYFKRLGVNHRGNKEA